jgi:hypothetical protein
VLFTKKILLPRADHYNTYIAGIGMGTFIGNCIFIFGGLLIANTITSNQHIMHWVIGAIFLGTAIYQAVKMMKRKGKPVALAPAAKRVQQVEELFRRIKKDY